jgi:hypothetical protein
MHDARFCSRCGLPLTAVFELTANGGLTVESGASVKSQRRRGMRAGAKIMFLSGVLFPIFLGLSAAADAGEPMLVPLIVFFVGLTCLLYFRLFGDDQPVNERRQSHRFDNRQGRTAIHEAERENVGAPLFIARKTGDIEQPSVTEATTHLFDQQ